jgi:hypothetical protein
MIRRTVFDRRMKGEGRLCLVVRGYLNNEIVFSTQLGFSIAHIGFDKPPILMILLLRIGVITDFSLRPV